MQIWNNGQTVSGNGKSADATKLLALLSMSVKKGVLM